MKVTKKIVAMLLVGTLCAGMLPGAVDAKISASKLKTPKLVTNFRSADIQSPMRKIEYYDISTDGMKMTVSGKTKHVYKEYRVAVRSTGSDRYMFWPDSFGIPKKNRTFSKTLDFTGEANGNYLVSVRFNTTGNGTFSDEAQMRYIPVTKTSEGVFIDRYKAIEKENAAVSKKNKLSSKEYLDTSMADMAHELRNGREYSDTDVAALTKAQQKTIKAFTKKIIGSETDNYQKMLKVHDYLCKHLYYDTPYNEANYVKKRQMAKKGLVTLNPYDLVKGLKSGKKMKTVCNGFSALYAAMMRSIKLPCRSARGMALRIPGMSWNKVSDSRLKETSHVWNEVYLKGRWIFVDITKDCPNDYTSGRKYVFHWDKEKRYCGFDSSKQAIGVTTLYNSYREEEVSGPVPKIKSVSVKKRSVTLRWYKVKKAVRYYIYRSTNGTKYSMIKKISPKELKYKSGKLKKGKKYYWKIRAVMPSGKLSAFSDYKVIRVK